MLSSFKENEKNVSPDGNTTVFIETKCEGLNRTEKDGYSTWGTSMRKKGEGKKPMLCSTDKRAI